MIVFPLQQKILYETLMVHPAFLVAAHANLLTEDCLAKDQLRVHVVSVAFVLVLWRARQLFSGTHISVSHILILPTSSFARSATAPSFAT